MQLTNDKYKALTHTARILIMAEQKPNHEGKAEHAKSIRRYRVRWDDMTPEEKEEAKRFATEDCEDLTPEQISAAVAALEE